ncbi:AmmeMemoRadiSam system protein B, partial [bacterium]|nr:AmmeMemoRadiSam system protein B [bacterium]
MSEESLNNYIRPHAVASNSGFYPSDPINLRLVVNRYMRNAENIGHGVPIGLIAPHAGYIYSGS